MDQSSQIAEAVRLFKEGQVESSRQLLRASLRSTPRLVEALLWLARVSTDSREAKAAAELALSLEPENEIAQRAVTAVQGRSPLTPSPERQTDVMRITGMTRSQARAVVWPFRGLNRPMGVLLDEGKITPRDLGYAFSEAKDPMIQKAAHTLLLAHLLGDKLKEPPPALTVIQGADYTGFQERRSRILTGLLMGIGATVFVLGLAAWLLGLLSGQPALMTLAIVFFLAAYPTGALSERFAEQSDQFRAGREAELRVIDILRASLNSPWILVHDLEWADRHWGDVDLILVGTGGIWAMEVKVFSHATRNRGDRWEYCGRRGWRAMSKNPGKQAQRNAMNVKKYLDSKRLPVRWVNAVVVWAGEEDLLQVEDPVVPVWRLVEIPERIEELWREQRLSYDEIQQAANAFEQVVVLMKERISSDQKKK